MPSAKVMMEASAKDEASPSTRGAVAETTRWPQSTVQREDERTVVATPRLKKGRKRVYREDLSRKGKQRRRYGQDDKKPRRQAKYIIRVPSTIPFASASTPPNVGSSRPPPPSTTPTPSVEPTPSVGPTPPTIGPTPSVVGHTPPTVVPTPSVPTPYIHPSPFILTPSSIPSPYVHQPSVDPAGPTDVGDPAPHDRPFIEPYGKGDARIVGQRPYWVGEHTWNSLLAHWNSSYYCIKCATAQKNRASEKGGVLHTRGSFITHEHVIHRIAKLGRAVHIDEVFTQTHIHKGTGKYVDERSRKTIGGSTLDADSRVDVDDEIIMTQCWKKGRLFGVGQLASNYSAGRGGIFRHQPSTSDTFDHNNVVSKHVYNSLLARFDNLENLQGQSTPLSSQQACPPQQPYQTTLVQEEDHVDSDDYDDY
ncbi:hypothetical protein V8G54_000921 [Vigna mungo]|uniref:Uncharacterized protein n=1 Tax=Vigna mungo TaxID=3915 RepID=A0AAQ3P7R4_VIGMU